MWIRAGREVAEARCALGQAGQHGIAVRDALIARQPDAAAYRARRPHDLCGGVCCRRHTQPFYRRWNESSSQPCKLSDSMMRQFQQVTQPLPGDLILLSRQRLEFCVDVHRLRSVQGKGVAVGTLQTSEEVRVVDTVNINTPSFPFIGTSEFPTKLQLDLGRCAVPGCIGILLSQWHGFSHAKRLDLRLRKPLLSSRMRRLPATGAAAAGQSSGRCRTCRVWVVVTTVPKRLYNCETLWARPVRPVGALR